MMLSKPGGDETVLKFDEIDQKEIQLKCIENKV